MNFKIHDDLPTEYFGTVLNFVDKIMNEIAYGMFDENGNEILDPNDWYENTRVQAPEWVIENKRGNCVDQVNLEYWFFKENGIKNKIYYISYEDGKGNAPSHMFIVLDNNGKIYWYENAWKTYAGLHEYYTLNECLTDIKKKYCPEKYMDTCKVYRIKDILEGSNPNQVLNRKIIKIKDTPRLYYISDKDFDTTIVNPCIPNNFLTNYNYEDTLQERVCFYPSIEQALSNNENVAKNNILYVYIPDEEYDYYKPSVEEVPTVYLTGETWITKPIRIKKIGNLKIVNELPDNDLTYTYGDNNTGTLKKWQYSVLNGDLIKDSWNDIQKIEEIVRNYKAKYPNASTKQAWAVAEKLLNKQIEEKNKLKELSQVKTYVVVDYYGKPVYESSSEGCQKYIKEHKNEQLAFVLKEVLPKMTRTEVKELFEDSKLPKKGLYITFGDNLEFNCYEVNVIDHNNQIIDQELCDSESEIKSIINDFKKEYKIINVKKEKETF